MNPCAITNHWGKAKVIMPKVQNFNIFTATSWTEAYSHHPQLVWHKGKLIASWSMGHLHEDCPGQRMVMAESYDDGETWSDPYTVVAPCQGEYAEACITSLGMRSVCDELIAYYANYDLTMQGMIGFAEYGMGSRGMSGYRCLQDIYAGMSISRDDGKTWDVSSTRIHGVIPNLSPIRLASGRLVFPSHQQYPFTDDPLGVSGWRIAGLPGLPAGFYEGAGACVPLTASWSDLGICEGSVYEPEPEVIRMMLRTSCGALAVAESRDQAENWSAPELTQYTDCGCRFQFGRLPDGRFFGLSCPDPTIPESCLRRTPLVLALSVDGNVFDRHFVLGDGPDLPLRFPGAYKHGRYGYPYSIVVGDTLFVIHSVGKEDIALIKVRLNDLA